MVPQILDRILGLSASARSILVSLFFFLLLLIGWSQWAALAFEDYEPGKRLILRWWQRPSTLLIVLGAGFTIYTGSPNRLTAMVVCLAFIIRHWENESLRL
jgi:hypothetical protein